LPLGLHLNLTEGQ
jgi:hypothetical protein